MLERLKRRLGLQGDAEGGAKPRLATELPQEANGVPATHRRCRAGDYDELLLDLLEDARSLAKGYTGRSRLSPILDGAVVELAAGAYNRLGLEGETSHSEGGVSQGIEGLPAHLKSMLDMYRLGKVGDA